MSTTRPAAASPFVTPSSAASDHASVAGTGGHAILDAIPFPVYILRKVEDGTIRLAEANAAANAATRGRIGNHIGTELDVYLADEPDVARTIRETMEDGAPRLLEHHYRMRTTGEMRWMRTSYMRSGDREVVVHAEDITERRASEARLEESEARLRGVFEQGTVAISLTAFDGQLLKVNPAFCAMLGRSEAELLASTFMALTHPDDLEEDLARKDALLAGEIPGYRMEKRFFHADGHVVWADLSVQLIRGAQGAPLYLLAQMQDVTARKDAELLHAADRSRLAGLLHRAPALIGTLCGPTHVCEMASEQLCQFVGRPSEELIGQPLATAAPEFVRQGFGAVMDGVFATGQPYVASGVPVLLEKEQGAPEQHYVNFVAQPIVEPSGSTSGIFVHGVDVTEMVNASREHERLVAELHDQRARLAAVVEQMPCAVIIGEAPTGRLVLGNQHVESMFGHPFRAAGTIEEYRDWVGYHADGRLVAANEWPMARAIAHGESTWNQIVRYPRPDAPNSWIRLCAAPIRDRTGAVVAGVVTAEDITAQMATEAALRAGQERYELVLKATNDVIYDWDIQSGSIFFSDALVTALGHRLHETTNVLSWWAEQIHPDDRQQVTASLDAAMAAGSEFWSCEYRFRRGDDSYAMVFDRGHLVRDSAGVLVRMIGSMADVTERRHLEAQLRESHKLEAVGRLAGGVAHDFNNLLCAILGYADLALMEADEASPVRSEVEEIRKAAQRAAQLTRQLLAFGRRQIRRPARIDVNAVVRDTHRLLVQLLGEDIQLVTQPSTGRATVMMDPSELDQILMNLIVNARDAMPRGGAVSIETARVRLPSAAGDGSTEPFIVLTVADSGSGIDSDTLPHIFEPYFTTKGDSGNGLGLSTVYGIVQQNGGRIDVQTLPGEGTRFEVYLPESATRASEPQGAPLSAVPAASGATVLLAEDENGVRALAHRILERAGFHVLDARHGADALMLWREHGDAIDVLVTDLVMPEMGGRMLADMLLESRPGLPVLFMSGYSDDEVTRRGFSDSRIAFLPKPFSAESLVEAVREALRQRG